MARMKKWIFFLACVLTVTMEARAATFSATTTNYTTRTNINLTNLYSSWAMFGADGDADTVQEDNNNDNVYEKKSNSATFDSSIVYQPNGCTLGQADYNANGIAFSWSDGTNNSSVVGDESYLFQKLGTGYGVGAQACQSAVLTIPINATSGRLDFYVKNYYVGYDIKYEINGVTQQTDSISSAAGFSKTQIDFNGTSNGDVLTISFTNYQLPNRWSNIAFLAIGSDLSAPLGATLAVSTQAVSAVTESTATAHGTIGTLGGSNPTAHGVCFSTSANPTTSDTCTNEGSVSATGAFTSAMTGLTSGGVTYHVRAYATDGSGTVYGADESFTTAPTVPPTVSITAQNAAGALTSGATTNDTAVTVSFTVSEAFLGFDSTDVTVGNGSLASFSCAALVCTATLTPTATGAVTVDVAVAQFTDVAGNANTAASRFVWNYDGTPPLVTITGENAAGSVATGSTTNDSSLNLTFTTSERVAALSAADITVTNGSLGALSVSGNTYRATLTPAATGLVTVRVAAGEFTDLAGNANEVATEYLWTYDGTSPDVVITAANARGPVISGESTDDESLRVTLTFSEAFTGFDVSDVSVGNGALSDLTCAGLVCTTTLTATHAGLVTVDVASGAFHDLYGNINRAAARFSWTYGSNPAKKADVLAGIQAVQSMGLAYVDTSLKAVVTRLDWLRANPNSHESSRQGIKLTFADPLVNKLLNENGQGFTPFTTADAAHWLKRAGQSPDGVVDEALNHVGSGLVAEAKKAAGLNLNPTGGPVVGDWSVWTEGEIRIGKRKANAENPALESELYAITAGVDKPGKDRVTGVAVTMGSGDVDIGSSGSRMSSRYLGLSGYTAFETAHFSMEVVLGASAMRADSTRIDGVQVLQGKRTNNLLFASNKIFGKTFTRGNFNLIPYGAISVTRIELNPYAEEGGRLALAYGDQSVRQTTLMMGADVNYTTAYGGGHLKPFAKVELGYDRRRTSETDLNYVGDLSSYRLDMSSDSDRYLTIRIGANYQLRRDLSSSLSVEHTSTSKSGYSNGLRAKLNWRF